LATDEENSLDAGETLGETMTTKKIRSTKDLSTLDDFLEEEGNREKFQAVAIKEVLAWQIAERMGYKS